MYREMMDTIGFVQSADAEVGAAMQRELTRQRQNIELIASENIVSPAVIFVCSFMRAPFNTACRWGPAACRPASPGCRPGRRRCPARPRCRWGC